MIGYHNNLYIKFLSLYIFTTVYGKIKKQDLVYEVSKVMKCQKLLTTTINSIHTNAANWR